MLARLAELPLLVVLVGLTGSLALLPALYAVGIDETARLIDRRLAAAKAAQ